MSRKVKVSLWFSAVLLPLLTFVGLRSRALQGLKQVKSSIVPEQAILPLLVISGVYLRTGTPALEETLLVVEVADTSITYDRELKFPLYAGAGIQEAWLVDLTKSRVEVHSSPEFGGSGYGTVSRFVRGEKVVSATVPGLTFEAAEALPPEGM